MKRLVLLGLLSSAAWADCDAPSVVQQLRPGAAWSMSGGDISTAVWMSTQTIPTKNEVSAAIAQCRTDATARLALKAQARLDVKNANLTQGQRLQALLILLDYDQ